MYLPFRLCFSHSLLGIGYYYSASSSLYNIHYRPTYLRLFYYPKQGPTSKPLFFVGSSGGFPNRLAMSFLQPTPFFFLSRISFESVSSHRLVGSLVWTSFSILQSLESWNNVQVTFLSFFSPFYFPFGKSQPIIEDVSMHESLMHFAKRKKKRQKKGKILERDTLCVCSLPIYLVTLSLFNLSFCS